MNNLKNWWHNRTLQSLVSMRPRGDGRAEKAERQQNRIERIRSYSCKKIETLLERCAVRITEVERMRFKDPGYSDAMSDSLNNILSLLQRELRHRVQNTLEDSSTNPAV